MFFECFLVVGIVSFMSELVAWLIGYFIKQQRRAQERSVRIHLAGKGWYWHPHALRYLDTQGNQATSEQLHDAMKDFQ